MQARRWLPLSFQLRTREFDHFIRWADGRGGKFLEFLQKGLFCFCKVVSTGFIDELASLVLAKSFVWPLGTKVIIIRDGVFHSSVELMNWLSIG